jgi:hypothetical protein
MLNWWYIYWPLRLRGLLTEHARSDHDKEPLRMSQIPETLKTFLFLFSRATQLISRVISFLTYIFLSAKRHIWWILKHDTARIWYSTKGSLQVKLWQMFSQLLTDVWPLALWRTGSRDLHGWVSKSTAKKPLSGNRAPCPDRAFKSPRLTVSGTRVRLS